MRSTLTFLLPILFLAAVMFADNEEKPSPKIGNLPVGRVLFLGNSITLHGPALAIGWEGNWGMAASTKENDYVHLLTAAIAQASGGKPEIRVRNIANFEREHATFDFAKELQGDREFLADLVIVAVGENVPELTTDQSREKYASAFAKLLSELKQSGQPAIFVRSSFWANPVKDEIMRLATVTAGATWVDISKISADKSHAAGSERKIDHAGVAGHPGDKGMQALANALFAAIEKRSKE